MTLKNKFNNKIAKKNKIHNFEVRKRFRVDKKFKIKRKDKWIAYCVGDSETSSE